MDARQNISVIVGATAVGKSETAILVAQKMNAEIISADSIQVYRGMDIGSAKPSQAERTLIPHHLLDIVPVTDGSFNVSRFRRLAADTVYDIVGRGKRPLIVGGTGLYINALVFPLNFSEAEPNFERRNELLNLEYADPGCLHVLLDSIDPCTAQRLHPNDTKRIIRAIEVFEQTGKPISEHGNDFSNKKNLQTEFNPTIAGISMDRKLLYERIDKRVDGMMEAGLLDETKHILAMSEGVRDLPAMQGLGYKQLAAYLCGEITLKDAVELIKRETRRFAKRQISWFKRDKRIRWFDTADYPSRQELASAISDYFLSEDKNDE